MWKLITDNLLWTEGQGILVALLLIGVIGLRFSRYVLYGAVLLFVFSLLFFRNPHRVCVPAIQDDSVIMCPADGTVIDIQYDSSNDLDGYAQKVSIFLSPFDVHVNWAPIAGTLEQVHYKPGVFHLAFLPKSSAYNERNDIVVQRDDGKRVLVRQIAGVVARRICCWVKKGELINAGQKYGMIRFGSRVEVFLPADVTLAVGVGQKVYGGYTVLGRWQ